MSVLLLVFLSACGATDAFRGPANMSPLARLDDSAALTARYFPGMLGSFYAVPGTETVFGVVQDAGDAGKLYLAGAGKERSWSVQIPLELDGVKVTAVQTRHVQIGDLQKDGVLDLVLVVYGESQLPKSGGRQERAALYMFELAKKVKLVWYQTLEFRGYAKGDEARPVLELDVTPEFRVDDKGVLERIVMKTARRAAKIAAPASDGGAKESRRDEDTSRVELIWDADLHVWMPDGSTEAVFKVPDISL